MFKKILIGLVTVVTSWLFSSASAVEHHHEGDIQPWKIGAEIFVNSNLFEPDFGDIGGGL